LLNTYKNVQNILFVNATADRLTDTELIMLPAKLTHGYIQ